MTAASSGASSCNRESVSSRKLPVKRKAKRMEDILVASSKIGCKRLANIKRIIDKYCFGMKCGSDF